jgi:hypothetical protein
MFLIEPCCTQKHWPELRRRLGEDGTMMWEGYGDLSITELLPVILARYTEVEMMLVAPAVPNRAAEALAYWLRRQLVTIDGMRKVSVLSRLTVVADLSEKRSPLASAWMKENPFGERLILKNVQQNDTALILPDIALYGPMNLTYGKHFTATATKNIKTIAELRKAYANLCP